VPAQAPKIDLRLGGVAKSALLDLGADLCMALPTIHAKLAASDNFRIGDHREV